MPARIWNARALARQQAAFQHAREAAVAQQPTAWRRGAHHAAIAASGAELTALLVGRKAETSKAVVAQWRHEHAGWCLRCPRGGEMGGSRMEKGDDVSV